MTVSRSSTSELETVNLFTVMVISAMSGADGQRIYRSRVFRVKCGVLGDAQHRHQISSRPSHAEVQITYS
jgi:hypothetical protein